MDDLEELARIVANTQNVPFVGARQLKLAYAILSSDWLAAHDQEVEAKALEAAANAMGDVISTGDSAEVAAPVVGETGRREAVAARDGLYEEPDRWFREYIAARAAAEFCPECRSEMDFAAGPDGEGGGMHCWTCWESAQPSPATDPEPTETNGTY